MDSSPRRDTRRLWLHTSAGQANKVRYTPAGVDVEEAVQEANDGGLAATALPHDGNGLSRRHLWYVAINPSMNKRQPRRKK